MAERWIYYFGNGGAEGDPQRKDILGGKGASLAAMSQAGLPVPSGFTISTECCSLFLDAGGKWPGTLREQVDEYLARLEADTGRRFGDLARPLLVSVRSGAAVSMPGMMDTILNCGLCPEMGDGEASSDGFWRVYGQFVVMFAKTVAGIDTAEFDRIEQQHRTRRDDSDEPLCPADHRNLVGRYMKLYTDRTGRDFPTEPRQALTECIEAVFKSWNKRPGRHLPARERHPGL